MKNRGFTLVELIAILTLLAVLAIIIGTNLSGLQDKQTDKNYNNFVKKIENAACTYLETSKKIDINTCKTNADGCMVKLSDLQEAGLIEHDIIDPSTDAIAENKNIKISFIDGEKKCEMQ